MIPEPSRPLEVSPTAACHVTCASSAGHSKKRASLHVRLVSFSEMKQPAHCALHPFGQIPTYQEGDLALFESGQSCSISRSATVDCFRTMPMPGRARSHGCSPRLPRWSRRSLNSECARLFESDKPWSAQRMPVLEERVRNRLGQLSRRLGNADWLDGGFSAGDLMMVAVLRRLNASDTLNEYPNLSAYVPAAKHGRRSVEPSMRILAFLHGAMDECSLSSQGGLSRRRNPPFRLQRRVPVHHDSRSRTASGSIDRNRTPGSSC